VASHVTTSAFSCNALVTALQAMPSQSYRLCPRCGSPVRNIAASGVCARCLLEIGLSEASVAWQAHAPGGLRGTPASPLGRVGRYELIEELAHGGMGVVYRARDLSLNRVVALKLMLGGQFASEREVKRFKSEAEAAARLDHPNIVPIYEAGEEGGRLFYTMKFMEGGSLSQRLGAGAPPPDDHWSAQVVAKIARAAHDAHEHGILHRDIKPGNVLLDSKGEPRLSDFGLAKWLEGADNQTLSGAALGSPSYMSPEQASGQPERLTAASDTYSLGALLYHLLTGRAPFEAATPLATMNQVLHKEPVSPRAIRPGVDADLEIICLKCLEKEPGRRYDTSAALADDLERWLRNEPIQARATGTIGRLAKWAQRNPGNTTLVLLSSLAISVLLVSQTITGVCLARANMKIRTANERANPNFGGSGSCTPEIAAREKENAAATRVNYVREENPGITSAAILRSLEMANQSLQ
jgi:eukaryotic-like serine/threonine-protein kinase